MGDKVRLVLRTDFATKFHQLGFWILIAFAIGIIIGNFYSERVISQRLTDSVAYKAIKIDGKEYDLKERP